ncbi:MAG: DUF7129 domain-containing putative zinc-binding protein [Thermovirgaceae bacterium]
MTPSHRYQCASCGTRFYSGRPVGRCPDCGGKVLIHVEGESRRSRRSCSGGSCAGCHGCGGR